MSSRRIVFFTSTVLVTLHVHADTHAQVHPDGFYFVISCAQYVQKPMPVFLTDKKDETVCITHQPVVALESLKAVTELHDNAEKDSAFFQLEMTPETTQRLSKVFTGMPSNTFAFVLENEVVFIFGVDPKKFNQYISVSGSSRGGRVKEFYNKLQQLVLKNE